MKSILFSLTLLGTLVGPPLTAAAQTPSSVDVYSAVDASLLADHGCVVACDEQLKRYDHTIEFSTRRSRGLIAGVSYSFGESPYNSQYNRAYGATIGYAQGAVSLSVSHQRKDNLIDANGTTPAVDLSARNSLVAANVNFGRFTGYAAYGRSRGDGNDPWDQSNPYGAVALRAPFTDSRDTLVGISVPSGAWTFLASYIRKDDRSVFNRDASQVAIGLSYALSRRTDLYTSLARVRNKNGAAYGGGFAGEAGRAGDRAFTIGVRHGF